MEIESRQGDRQAILLLCEVPSQIDRLRPAHLNDSEEVYMLLAHLLNPRSWCLIFYAYFHLYPVL